MLRLVPFSRGLYFHTRKRQTCPQDKPPTQLSFLRKEKARAFLLLELLRAGLSGSSVHRELAVTHGSRSFGDIKNARVRELWLLPAWIPAAAEARKRVPGDSTRK